MRRAALLLLPLLLCTAAACGTGHFPDPVPLSEPPQPIYTVSGIPHDGDTFKVLSGSTVRILGVDTPEIPPAVPGPGDCYGPEAAAKTQEILTGRTVQLQSDPEQGDTDQYGRLLRYVSVPDTEISDLSLYLIEHGYARVYTAYPVARTPQYLAAQQRAQDNKVGGWNVCQW